MLYMRLVAGGASDVGWILRVYICRVDRYEGVMGL